MILKMIRVTTCEGQRAAFLELQQRWNQVMARQEGYLWSLVATDPERSKDVCILLAMETRAHLDKFMAGEHDIVEAETNIRSTYESLQVRILDVEPADGTPQKQDEATGPSPG